LFPFIPFFLVVQSRYELIRAKKLNRAKQAVTILNYNSNGVNGKKPRVQPQIRLELGAKESSRFFEG